MLDGVILAWEANGQPLLPAHGFPLRLIVPTWYGMASVKWLKAITVIDHPFQGVQQTQVYRLTFSAADAGRPIQKKSVRAAMKPPGYPGPDQPQALRRAPAQWSCAAWPGPGYGPIRKVEVSTDDRRTWQRAVLEPPVSAVHLDAVAVHLGGHPRRAHLSSRATDVTGNVQPLRPFWNMQGMAQNGVERIAVQVV